MKATQDEINSIMDEITVAVGQILINGADLQMESITGDIGADAVKKKITRLKKQTQQASERLQGSKRQKKHRVEIERQRKEHETPAKTKLAANEAAIGKCISIRNEKGVVIGRIQQTGENRINYLSNDGRVISREINGITLDSKGRLKSLQRIGQIALGQNLGRKE